MKTLAAILATALWAALAGVLPAADAPDRLLLAGSDGGLWLVRFPPKGDSFDLACREVDANWKWVEEALTGRPAAAAASGRELHLLFSHPTPGYLIFTLGSPTPSTQLIPQGPDWPEGVAPLAMCQATDFAQVRGGSVLAVVARLAGTGTTQPAASAPATEPATQTAPASAAPPPARPARAAHPADRVDLGIFQYVRGSWVRLADLRNVPHPPPGRVFLAAFRGAVLLVLPGEAGRGIRVLEYRADLWQPVDLPARLASDRPLALLEVADRLVLAASEPADNPAERNVLLATLRGPAGGPTVRPITRGGKAVTWPTGQPPLVTRLGEQLALMWRRGEALESATCDPLTAIMLPASTVRFAPRPDNRGAEFIEFFMWALLIAIFLPMFLMRAKGPMGFVLPEQLRPAPLGRRLLAGLIDFLPHYVLANVALLLTLPGRDEKEMLDLAGQIFGRQAMPLYVAVIIIGMLVAFSCYCTIFERLFGATIGKRVMKMRVVGFDGQPPSLRGCLLRNLVKVIEIMWLLPIPILILMPLLNRNRQRLGDMLARTVVVDASGPAAPPTGEEKPRGEDKPPDSPD